MAWRLRKPTAIFRATCIQQMRPILLPELDANPNDLRRVQIILNVGVRIYTSLDLTPEEIALSRVHLAAPFYQNNNHFHLLSGQTLYAMSEQGSDPVLASVLCEYVESI